MAVDLRVLRTAAAREQREIGRAHEAYAAALLSGRAVRERGAKAADLRRAERKIQTAAGKLVNVPDRIRDLIVPATPDEVLAALERDVPIVLLPVRLEARLLKRQGGWDLGVRVFPDAIHGDAHERELTQDEQDAGAAFWARPADDHAVAFQELAALFGPARAAWVAEETREGYSGATAATRFTRPAWTQALPDRFVFSMKAGAALAVVEGERVRNPLATGPDPRLAPNAEDGTDAGMRWMSDFDQAVAEGMERGSRSARPPPRRWTRCSCSACAPASPPEPPRRCSAACSTPTATAKGSRSCASAARPTPVRRARRRRAGRAPRRRRSRPGRRSRWVRTAHGWRAPSAWRSSGWPASRAPMRPPRTTPRRC